MNIVTSFSGKYEFLSNFFPSKVVMDLEEYATVEHAFLAAKTFDSGEREKIRLAETPGKAKRLGRDATLRKDWEDVKTGVMEGLVESKFSDAILKRLLLDTEDAELIEGNVWGDRVWGMVHDSCGVWIGENKLGKILMRVRERLRGKS